MLAETYTYTCFKCGDPFTIHHDLELEDDDEPRPTCTPCFKTLLKIDTVDDYLAFTHRQF